jgi:hypothetical protein
MYIQKKNQPDPTSGYGGIKFFMFFYKKIEKNTNFFSPLSDIMKGECRVKVKINKYLS